ncbi:hypothetical protein [Gordonia sp. HS-NH1]|uniref:hypothetical protein n=1 Tax=Gordonia sp. HS-NH1 TaxID=1435068 RepID=UPI0006E19F0C|nr:hypothetical protein [Gordonia sp. HS-NH1]
MSGYDVRRNDRNAAMAARLALAAAHEDATAVNAVLAEAGGHPDTLASVATILASWVAEEAGPAKVEAAALEAVARHHAPWRD